MQKFICFIRGGEPNPEAQDVYKKQWTIWIEGLPNNTIIDSGILTTDGKIVSKNGIDVRTFSFNLKENASGFILLRANDLDEAVALTKDCPIFLYEGNVTVRPIVGKY